MKRIVLSILAAGALLVSGCDTIETKTITISLGGDKGTPAPSDVSTAHVGVYEIVDGWLEKPVASKSLSASGSTSIVVPAHVDLYIFVMAVDDTEEDYYFGAEWYYGASGGGDLVTERGPGGGADLVYIYLSRYDTSEGEGAYVYVDYSEGPGLEVYCEDSPYLPGYLEEISNIQIDRKKDDGSFNTIDRQSYEEEVGGSGGSYTYFDELDLYPADEVMYTYRARLYVPLFGLYYFFWGEDSQSVGGM